MCGKKRERITIRGRERERANKKGHWSKSQNANKKNGRGGIKYYV